MVIWHLPLLRPRLSALVAVSALAGGALQPLPTGGWLPAGLGVFLLAAGASALNQVQEREIDRRMTRTAGRPLPAGWLSPRAALLIAFFFLAAGLAALAAAGRQPLILGLFALILYNGVYTPLKKKTVFAVLPGALCGALPPVIGWTAAGGHPADFRCILLAGLLFLWQVPHFWLFAEKHRDDYRRAGLPLPAESFARLPSGRVFLAWGGAVAATTLALAAFALADLPLSRFTALFTALLLLALLGTTPLRRRPAAGVLRHALNHGLAAVLVAICVGRWLTL